MESTLTSKSVQITKFSYWDGEDKTSLEGFMMATGKPVGVVGKLIGIY